MRVLSPLMPQPIHRCGGSLATHPGPTRLRADGVNNWNPAVARMMRIGDRVNLLVGM
jgi:hypothetical protein